MKKLVSFLIIGMFLSIPFMADATLLGTGKLNVSWSTPTSGGNPNYYTDYDGRVESSSFGYTTDWEEIFCVSEDDANRVEYVKFYTITPDLDTIFVQAGLYAKMAQAAWIADNWTSYGASLDDDTLKGEAQKAVWEIMGVTHKLEGDGIDFQIWEDASKISNYQTENWYYADSRCYQDYLTPTAPVPEPATMLLLGTGLIGLAGVGRKKLLKK